MTDPKGWDVVVHFNTKEDADKFATSINEFESVGIAGEYPDSAEFVEATYVETLECPRSRGVPGDH